MIDGWLGFVRGDFGLFYDRTGLKNGVSCMACLGLKGSAGDSCVSGGSSGNEDGVFRMFFKERTGRGRTAF